MEQRLEGNSLSAEYLAKAKRYKSEKHAEKLSGLFRSSFNIGEEL